MSSFMTMVGKVLRLVGISSPEDAAAKREVRSGGPRSWKDSQREKRPTQK